MEGRAAGGSNSPSWTPDLGSGLIVAGSLLLAATVVARRGVEPVAAMLILLSAVVAWHRWILSWQVLACLVIASVFFVPVARYALAIKLPFGLEFYRLTVAFVLLVWVASLLVDPAVRLRRTRLDGPVALIVAASLCSIAVNFGRVAPLASAVLKATTLSLSFIIFFYFIASVISTVSAVVAVTKFIVSGGAVVAVFAVVEQRTGFNVLTMYGPCFRSCNSTLRRQVRGCTCDTESSGRPGLHIIRSRSASSWRCASRSGLHSHDRDQSCGRSPRS